MQAIFLDIETTGLDATQHNTIDIACKVVHTGAGTLRGAYQSIVKQPISAWEKRDPTSMLINGYTWEQVQQGKDPKTVGQEIIQLFQALKIERGKAVFICQNPAFDRSFFTQLVDVYTQEKLNWPYHWLDLASMYWVVALQQRIKSGIHFPEKMNLSKNEIAREYRLPVESDPHKAVNGVDHLILCYQAVLGVQFAL